MGHGFVRMLSDKLKAVADFPVPRARSELQLFLGMSGYYRCFCKNFATIVLPLTNLLRPKTTFKCNSEAEEAFDECKLLLTSAPVLKASDLALPFLLEVDSSQVCAGAVLLQTGDDGLNRPVAYFTRKFTPCQARHSTVKKETLALLLALNHFHVFLGSKTVPLVVYIDHNPLVFLAKMFNHYKRLMQWALMLQEYELQIKHKKGSENVLADFITQCIERMKRFFVKKITFLFFLWKEVSRPPCFLIRSVYVFCPGCRGRLPYWMRLSLSLGV